MRPHGRLALVGSGEYLPVMAEFEAELLKVGGSNKYVQLPTAAGRESESRIAYWKRIGAEQAERIGAEQVYLPVFNRDDAMNQEIADLVDGAGLIYMSGGDPHFLAETLAGTPVWNAIEKSWRAGASLAGCSAGAMALGVALIVVLPAGVSDYWLMLAMMLAGVGFGFFQTPNNRVLIGSAPRNRAGALGGLQATTRVFGQTFGGAVVASVFALGFGAGPQLGLMVAIVFALLAVTVNVIRYRQASSTQEG